eukprot:Sspe_Gene.68676::Locus_40484_Transcript_1_3_Confidence_0.600_Length_2615::g.68676::m.68676
MNPADYAGYLESEAVLPLTQTYRSVSSNARDDEVSQDEDTPAAEFARFPWKVVTVRANRQITRLNELTQQVKKVVDKQHGQTGHTGQWTEEEQARYWKLSSKLLKKIELVNILLEVLDAQSAANPKEEPVLRRQVLVARQEAEKEQQRLFDLLVSFKRSKGR